jgi:hypothetical protein
VDTLNSLPLMPVLDLLAIGVSIKNVLKTLPETKQREPVPNLEKAYQQ